MTRVSMCRSVLQWICVFVLIQGSIGFDPSLAARSLSSYNYMKYDRCLRVKIRDNSDDDGNSYFYNGAYRSQGVMYMAYRLCSDSSCSDGGTSYLVQGSEVLDNNVAYTQEHCNACSQQCSSRRQLEDGSGSIEVDCKTCVKQCKTMIKNTYDGDDETEYLDCQASHVDDSGIQYYSSPACDNHGELTIGLFYDQYCTVKKDDGAEYGSNFAMNTFTALQELFMNCAEGICDAVEEDGLQCTDGSNFNENVEDDMGVCRAYKKVTKEWKYATPKQELHLALVLTSIGAFFGILFGSYTYFVRHKRVAAEKAATEALAESGEPTKAEYAVMT